MIYLWLKVDLYMVWLNILSSITLSLVNGI